jgi:ABC-2 type transport system ATP-binding protein
VYYLTNTLMIEIRDLSFGYNPDKLLYKKLNLSLKAGRIYGLLGKNGAGKSTLLKNMVGLLFPNNLSHEGSVSVNNFKPHKRQPSFLQTIYFIPEQTYVPALSIKRYVDLYAPFYPRFDENQFYTFLKELEVTESGKLTDLSFGQQKKFIIAFGLACNTPVLLMDEPTNGLDIPSKSHFRKLMASTLTEDRLFIISTHQVRDLDNLIDEVVILENGEILLHASIGDISERLVFKTVQNIPEAETIFYRETSLQGTTIVKANTKFEESKVNLEHLFNAVVAQPHLIKMIFQHTT